MAPAFKRMRGATEAFGPWRLAGLGLSRSLGVPLKSSLKGSLKEPLIEAL